MPMTEGAFITCTCCVLVLHCFSQCPAACVFCYTMQDLQRRLDLSKLEAETFSAQAKGKDDKIADLEAR